MSFYTLVSISRGDFANNGAPAYVGGKGGRRSTVLVTTFEEPDSFPEASVAVALKVTTATVFAATLTVIELVTDPPPDGEVAG
jgi:hypothetical protein